MSKYLTLIAWDDCPHLRPPHVSPEELADYERGLLPHQRQARRTGRPSLGSGAIYPVSEDDYLIDPIPIPDWWQRAYALDVGWERTAMLLGARDPDTDTYYLTGEYYATQKEPVVHVHAIKSMMPWDLSGCIDPAAAGSNQFDGRKVRFAYDMMGLKLVNANNAIEAGLHHVLVRLQTGQLKVFRTLTQFMEEMRIYRRDVKGRIVKEKDHLMDCMRYLLNTEGIFRTRPQERAMRHQRHGEW